MTEPYPYGYEEETYEEITAPGDGDELGVPVRVVASTAERVREVSPDYGACMTWTVTQAGAGRPTQILPRKPYRAQAKIVVVALGGATAIAFNSREDPLGGNPNAPQGAVYALAAANIPYRLPDWENQQPCYAFGVGGTPTIITQDESFAEC